MESLSDESSFAIFGQLGFHRKGSAIRNRNFTVFGGNGEVFRPPTYEFIYNNLSLTIGGKKYFGNTGPNAKPYYMFGLRGDYTLTTNLGKYDEINKSIGNGTISSLFFPSNDFVRKLNYGITLGGGIEVPFGELIGGQIEITVNPDFSAQYRQPGFTGYNPITGNNDRIYPERITRNLTFEITAGFRFLRKVEYVD
ncbi:MAG: hypothetical protein H6577_16360 [Lewinellaceae bacterium]|nr:hypothetical protein [Saprospiraceae bacterium]MCB9339697.1 hypothetical protein [Lewinellaceae bacterium]